MSARDAILARLKRAQADAPPAHPGKAALPALNAPLATQFQARLEAVSGTMARVDDQAAAGREVARWLRAHNLPARARLSPDPWLEGIDFAGVEVEAGIARPEDITAITAAVAGIAETGTLFTASSPHHAVTLNFLPENHIVILPAERLVPHPESAWDMLLTQTGGAVPRSVSMVTGPSRTADIEQTITLGAHGPMRLHVVLVGAPGGKPGA